MSLTFSIDVEDAGDGRGVLVVEGDVDLYTSPQLRDRLAESMENGRLLLVVDLAGTTFIDSSGLGALIGAHARLRERRGRLVLCCPRDEVVRTLELTGLDQVMTVMPSREQALAEVARPSPDHR